MVGADQVVRDLKDSQFLQGVEGLFNGLLAFGNNFFYWAA